MGVTKGRPSNTVERVGNGVLRSGAQARCPSELVHKADCCAGAGGLAVGGP